MPDVDVKIMMVRGYEDLKPTKAHPGDAAIDLKARVGGEILPGCSMLIPAGFSMELPDGFEAQVRARSGLALKHGIGLANGIGTIDSSYRGEVGAILINHGTEVFHINRGDRIAQMVINKLPETNVIIVDELSDTKRGSGGFGSTGK